MWRPKAGWKMLAGLVALVTVPSLTLTGLAQSAAARTGQSGTITGTVFRDFGDNGQQAANDPGVGGIAVTATDCSGDTVGTATTGSTGAYTLAVTDASCSDIRVAFTVPNGLYPTLGTGTTGVQSGGAVQYLSSTTGTASLGLVAPGDYCQSNPTLTVPCQRAVVGSGGSRTPLSSSALYGLPYDSSGDSPALTTEATIGQVGSIWGNQMYRAPDGTQWDFTSALFKSYTALGRAGLGGVYVTKLTGSQSPNASTFTIIPDAGTDPRPTEDPTSTTYNWYHDPAAYAEVYKIGLGDMQLSQDQKTLYVVNLNDKKLYAVPINPPTSASDAPTAGTPKAISLPLSLPGAGKTCAPATSGSQSILGQLTSTVSGTLACAGSAVSSLLGTAGCSTSDLSPFGLGQLGTTLYVTLTCTGPTVSSLRGYIYAMNEATGAFSASPAFELPLNYPRGCTLQSGNTGGGACVGQTGYPARTAGGPDASAGWNPWVTGTANFTNPAYRFSPASTEISYPQAELSQVAFQANGNMEIAIKDRDGDQTGTGLNPGDLSDPAAYGGFDAGDLLLACGNPASGWTLESDGKCGGVSGAGVGDGMGPGGGQFYQEFFPATTGADHEETALGSVVQIPSFADLVTTSFDPTDNIVAGGLHHDSNSDGSQTGATQIYYTYGNSPNDAGGFGKSSGLGEVASLCAAAPVSIDGYVWKDTNGDGLHEAGEPGVAGVTVTLESGDTVLATTTTDSSGRYTFSNVNVPSLTAGASYKVVVDTPGDFASGGPLAGLTPAKTGAGTDSLLSSEGTPSAPGATAAVTAPPTGENQAANFGFAKPSAPKSKPKPPVSPLVTTPVPVTG